MRDLGERLADGGHLLGLSWAFKSSFVQYIAGMPDGVASAAEGAYWIDGSYFLFEPRGGGWFDPATGTGRLHFAGVVAFSGHGGLLSLRIANPIVDLDGDRARMSVLDLSGVWGDGHPSMLVDLHRVSVRPDGDLLFIGPASSTLNAAATRAFNGVYSTGDPFEDVLITVRTPPTSPHPGRGSV